MAYKKISVIGGAGFVGTNFCQALFDADMPFEIIDLKSSKRFPDQSKIADIRDIGKLRASLTGDVVVNFAAVHRDDVSDRAEYYTTNVDGARNTISVCTEKGIKKIIFTSTVAVYGFCDKETGEDGQPNPFNDYGKSKLQSEAVYQEWAKQPENSLFIVRPTVIFGEGNRGNVFNLFNQINSGKFIMVGSGKNHKSIAYVGNVVAFLQKCITAEKDYFVCNYVDMPNMDMNTMISQVRGTLKGQHDVGPRLPYGIAMGMGLCADLVAKITGKKLVISSIRVKKFCADTAFSSRKSELDGFEPPYSLKEGIERTLQSEFLSPDPNREIFFTE